MPPGSSRLARVTSTGARGTPNRPVRHWSRGVVLAHCRRVDDGSADSASRVRPLLARDCHRPRLICQGDGVRTRHPPPLYLCLCSCVPLLQCPPFDTLVICMAGTFYATLRTQATRGHRLHTACCSRHAATAAGRTDAPRFGKTCKSSCTTACRWQRALEESPPPLECCERRQGFRSLVISGREHAGEGQGWQRLQLRGDCGPQ